MPIRSYASRISMVLSWWLVPSIVFCPQLAAQDVPHGDALATPAATGATSSVTSQLSSFLQQSPESIQDVISQSFAKATLSASEAKEVLHLLWDFHASQIQKQRAEEHEAEVIEMDQLKMPFSVRRFGEAPAGGHSLYLSMHGGGGAPKRVNDQQWRNQKSLYQLDEGIYVAPRAPTDTWNLWHQAHIDTLFTRLIENMIAIEGVNPNRVYITGYSAGGDGVFQLAPRMADQLAAAAAMAGHPNETQPDGLRNLPFTLHMGANDAAYGRNERAAEWRTMLDALRKADSQGYEHWVEIHSGKGHWMDRQDAEGVRWMKQFERDIIPDRVVWLQDDVLHTRYYWLAVQPKAAQARQKIIAHRQGSNITIDESSVDQITLLLRDDMLDLDQPITVFFGEKQVYRGKVNRTLADIARTLADRGDPQATFCASLTLKLN